MQLWYDVVESEKYILYWVWESYEAAYISYFADKSVRASVWPMKFQVTYMAERRFEIQEFVLTNPEYSYQQVTDAFRMPKTTVFKIAERNMNLAFSSYVAMSCLCLRFARHVNLPFCSVGRMSK